MGVSPRGGEYVTARAPEHGMLQVSSGHEDMRGGGGQGYPLAVMRNQRERERERQGQYVVFCVMAFNLFSKPAYMRAEKASLT